ncbi:hypothetical protein MUN82_03285 [Hymenobacter aerilatus]|uniref:Uncharacterized protein n=1 Tax=Hymenobacter aerilatus TaxID=2932251 RepID=A0A8T9SVN4_9BACT|nr:hypothetical protein [Hymenobacter aerilatus]UOR06128.1 hypothetical protein MUN82_03285 [Hymenobacter aerilatus]
MDISTLDFQQARIKLVLFKSRLRSVLYGVREPEDSLFVLRDNPLGQWLYNVVKPKYSDFPEVRTIEQTMQTLLETGRDLVRRYQRGQIEESRTGLEKVEQYAAQIETLLLQLEQSTRSVA